jgi:hypothetical protein
MALSRKDALATAQRSPAAASARDRDGWVGLFTLDARIQDPVGSQPHVGRVAIAKFFDTFIGPRDVAYHPDVDIVSSSTVIRDGVLEAAVGSVTLRVPIYIRYDVTRDDDGELRIAALSAFWELPAMVGQFLRGGVGALPAGVRLSRLLLVNQGLTGTLGFLGGFRGAGLQGKRRFREFLADAGSGDEVAVRRRLGKGARITLGDDTPMSAAELLSRLAGARPRKVVVAGHHMVAGIDHGGRRDVLVADVAAKSFEINGIRYFSDGD